MNKLARYLPWAILTVAVVFLIVKMVPARDASEQLHQVAFGRLPVQEAGRVKPLDSLARSSLLIISGKQTFVDDSGKEQPAIRWLLDTMTSGPAFYQDNRLQKAHFPLAGLKHRVFRIDNDQVQTMMGVEKGRSGFRYSYAELEPRLSALQQAAARAREVSKRMRPIPVFEGKVLELAEHVMIFRQLAALEDVYPGAPEARGERWITMKEAKLIVIYNKFRQELKKHGGDLNNDELLKQKFYVFLGELKKEGRDLAQVNPLSDNYNEVSTSAESFRVALKAYAENNTPAFNQAVVQYQQAVDKTVPAETSDAETEAFFNHFEPFYLCAILYVCVFLLACCSFLGWTEPLARSAFWLAVLTLVLHTWALGMRMYLQGRPPVTNLYSSAVFIGWGAVVVGLILEAIFKNGLGLISTSVIGAATMVVAIFLAGTGDTLNRLQAVLDTNFWLATHVTCISLGYTATFLAGVLGWLYIGVGLFGRPKRELTRSLTQMIYGIVCFAMVLSFTGTVLGGIWADQSWGRFWGWDSKENGALIIVIWNALVLHARWAGMVKARGVAVLTVVGNIVTAWSWFGTNQLGVGLHSYGFNDRLAMGLVIWWGLNALIIGLGLVPLRYWRSLQPQAQTAPVPTPSSTTSLGPAHA